MLANGKLAVSKLDVGVAGGHAVGSAALDGTAHPPAASAEIALRGVRLESLSPSVPAASKRITGTLQAHAALRSSGVTPAAWLDSAAGTLAASLSDGSIAGTLDAELGLEGGTVLKRVLLGSGAPVPIRCASIALDVYDGRGTIRSLVFDSERTLVTGTGSIDLPAETMDIVLTPDPKHDSLFNLDRSIRLLGPLRKPARSLVARAGGAPATTTCTR